MVPPGPSMSSRIDLLLSISDGSVFKKGGGLVMIFFVVTFKFVGGNKKSKYGFI